MNKNVDILLLTMALVSCSKPASDGPADPKEIFFGTAGARDLVGGTESYLRSNGFEVMAFDRSDFTSAEFIETAIYDPSDEKYRISGRFWPYRTIPVEYDFFAASPTDASNIRFECVGGEPQLRFEGSGSAARSSIRTSDVIVSCAYGCTASNSGSGVELHFEHILSCLSEIKFRMEDVTGNLGAIVTEIDICEPFGYTYHFNCGPGYTGSYWTCNTGSGRLSVHSWSGTFKVNRDEPVRLTSFPEMLLIPCNRDYSDGPYYDISVLWTYFDISTEDTLGEGRGYLYGLEMPPGKKTILTLTIPTNSEMSVGADIYVEGYNDDSIEDITL